MKHSARAIIRRAEIPLLAVIVLYKAATNLLFVPLMQQLWSLTLRFAPMHYLSNNNASDIFSSPAIILCITLIAILTAFWALYEFSVLLHGLDLARKGETIRLPALLRTSLADIRHAFLPQNWLVLVYSAVLIPFTNFFLAYNYITQLAVPEYIMGVIRANSRYYLLYLAAGAALLFLCVSWVLVLPLFVLERKSLWQSVKESFCCIRRRVFRAFLLLLRWNLSVVLRSLLLTAAVAVPLYGIIIAVGLQSTQAMFALSRAALAIDQGCEWAELDVQMTRDGVVMVTHDTSLRRCTGRNENIYDLTYNEVCKLDAGRWFGQKYTGAKVPTLEEVLDLCKGKIQLNIEIKPNAATPELEAETIRIIREKGFAQDCTITSQSYETLCKVKELAPEIRTGYILALGVGSYYDLPAADFFSVQSTFITSGMVQQIHKRSKTISAWTVNREEDASELLSIGVDDLITDKPDMIQQLLSEDADLDNSLVLLRDFIRDLFAPSDVDEPTPEEETIEEAIEDPDELLDAS